MNIILYNFIFLVLLIYNFIYFRKDINLGLSFCSALLIGKIILDLVVEKKYTCAYNINYIYVITIILFFTGLKIMVILMLIKISLK